jgi:hypothetical protein
MVEQQYIDYIKNNINTYPIESLKTQLLNSGVSTQDVDEAVRLATGNSNISEHMFESDSKIVNEEIKGSFDMTQRSTYYRFFLTNKRLIVAKTSGTFWWWMILGTIGTLIAWGQAKGKGKQLESLTPESILKSNKHNFEVAFEELTIELNNPKFLSPGKLTLNLSGTKKTFMFEDKKAYQKTSELLKQIIPNKISVK